MKISVNKSIKLGLPSYSSISFSAGIEGEIDAEIYSSANIEDAFKKVWEIVEKQIDIKSTPYSKHPTIKPIKQVADTDPDWLKGSQEPLPWEKKDQTIQQAIKAKEVNK